MSTTPIPYVRIKKNHFFDGEKTSTFVELKGLYQSLKIDYPKFHKMDSLSQLALVMIHALVKKTEIDKNTILLFANSISSFNTDIKHQESIRPEAYFPSPATFVYTLPNISLGEVAIKYQLKNENLFLVCDHFSPTLYTKHAFIYFNDGAETALCLWLDDHKNNLDGFAFILTKSDVKSANITETQSKLNELYDNG